MTTTAVQDDAQGQLARALLTDEDVHFPSPELRECYFVFNRTFAEVDAGTPAEYGELVDITELYPGAGKYGTETICCAWCDLPVIPEARFCHNCGVPASRKGWDWLVYLAKARARLGYVPPVDAADIAPPAASDDQGSSTFRNVDAAVSLANKPAVVEPAAFVFPDLELELAEPKPQPAAAPAAKAACAEPEEQRAEKNDWTHEDKSTETPKDTRIFWDSDPRDVEAHLQRITRERIAREQARRASAPAAKAAAAGERLFLEDGTPFETVAAVNASFWAYKPRDKSLFKTPLVAGQCVSRSHPSRPRTWAETDPGYDKDGVSTGPQPTHLYATRAGFWRPGRILPNGPLAQHKVNFLFERCGDIYSVDRARSMLFDLRYLDEPHRFGRNVWKKRKSKKKQ